MPDEQPQKSAAIGRLERLTTGKQGETIVNILKAGLASTPFCGGIASLINDYIPSARLRRLEEFAAKIAEDLRNLEDRVKSDYLLTEDFAFMFEKCFRGVAENPQTEKLEAFRGILVNSALPSNLSEEEKEYFVNLANNLSALHLRMLRFMAYPVQYLKASGIPQERIAGGFSRFFPVAIPGVSLEVIRSAFADLFGHGFTNTDPSIFATMTSGGGLQLLGNRVTELGKRFIAFCSSPASE